jgi:hypothetical protein
MSETAIPTPQDKHSPEGVYVVHQYLDCAPTSDRVSGLAKVLATQSPALTSPTCMEVEMADQTLDTPEEWRLSPKYPAYEFSNLGRVRRIGRAGGARVGHVLSTNVDGYGYASVQICMGGKKRTVRIHTVICPLFNGPPPTPDHEVAHNNGDKTNPCASNLRWATHAENVSDMLAHGTRRVGSDHWSSKLTEDQVRAIRLRHAAGESCAALSRAYRVGFTTIGSVLNRETWKHV